MSEKRIYVVVERSSGKEHLVAATLRGRAQRHVAEGQYATRLASQTDLMRLLGAGMEVQQAAEHGTPGRPPADPFA